MLRADAVKVYLGFLFIYLFSFLNEQRYTSLVSRVLFHNQTRAIVLPITAAAAAAAKPR